MLGSSPPSTELIYLLPRQVYFNKAPQVIQMCISSEEPLGQEQRLQKQSAYLVPGSRFLNAFLHEKETRVPWIPSLCQGRYKISLDILSSQKARKSSNTNGDTSKRHRDFLSRRDSQWPNRGQLEY